MLVRERHEAAVLDGWKELVRHGWIRFRCFWLILEW